MPAMLDLLTKWKTDWLYKAMPCIYLIAGLTAIFCFDNPPGYGAGAILILAACLIVMRNRMEHRK
jgi:hypothetical protein